MLALKQSGCTCHRYRINSWAKSHSNIAILVRLLILHVIFWKIIQKSKSCSHLLVLVGGLNAKKKIFRVIANSRHDSKPTMEEIPFFFSSFGAMQNRSSSLFFTLRTVERMEIEYILFRTSFKRAEYPHIKRKNTMIVCVQVCEDEVCQYAGTASHIFESWQYCQDNSIYIPFQ